MFVKCKINVPKYLELVNQNMLLLFKLQFILTQDKIILIVTRRIINFISTLETLYIIFNNKKNY